MRRLTLIRERSLGLCSLGALFCILSSHPRGRAEEKPRELVNATLVTPTLHLVNLAWQSAQPRGLNTGQANGLELTYLYPMRSLASTQRDAFGFRLGFDLGYAGVQENSRVWAVRHHEWSVAARLEGAKRFGRGSLGLSLSIGGALIQERRDRHQAARLDEATLEMNIEKFADETRQFIPEASVSLSTRIRLIKMQRDEIGLSTSARLAWRFQQGKSDVDLTPWGWAILIGGYWEIGVNP